MDNRLQFVHSTWDKFIGKTSEDVRNYIDEIKRKSYIDDGYPALFAEPMIFAYGDRTNPNIILAIGSRGNGTAHDSNQVFIIDTASIEATIETLKAKGEENDVEVSKVIEKLTEIEELLNQTNLAVVKSGVYNRKTQSLDLYTNTDNIIPIKLNELIDEWTVEENSKTPIQLSKKKVSYDDTTFEWKDVLSADIKIHEAPFNILKKSSDGNSIYADGRASTILAYDKDGNVSNVQEELKNVADRIGIADRETNIVSLKKDGLYASVDLEYESGTNDLIFSATNTKGEVVSKAIRLNSFSFLEHAHYSAEEEAIHIIFKDNANQLQEIVIPCADLIREWEPDNGATNVDLSKVEDKGSGHDKLTANVKILNASDNILEDVGHHLYVKGVASSIKYNDNLTVFDAISAVNDALSLSDINISGITADLERAYAKINEVSANTNTKVNTVSTNTTAKINEVNSALTQTITTTATSLTNKINEVNSALTSAITASETRSNEKIATANTRIDGVVDNIGALSGQVITVSGDVEDLQSDLESVEGNIGDIQEFLSKKQNAKIKYDIVSNNVTFTDNDGQETSFKINAALGIDKISYDNKKGEIVLLWKDASGIQQETRIPVSDLLLDTLPNETSTAKVTISKDPNTYQEIVSVDVKQSSASGNALVIKEDNGLYVKDLEGELGKANDNIASLTSALTQAQSAINALQNDNAKIWKMLETLYNKSTLVNETGDILFEMTYNGGSFATLKENGIVSNETTKIKGEIQADLDI